MPKPRMYCDRCARLVRPHQLRTVTGALAVPWRLVCSRCYQQLVSQHLGNNQGESELADEMGDVQLELPF